MTFTLRHSSLDIAGSQIVETFAVDRHEEADLMAAVYNLRDCGTDSVWYVTEDEGGE